MSKNNTIKFNNKVIGTTSLSEEQILGFLLCLKNFKSTEGYVIKEQKMVKDVEKK